MLWCDRQFHYATTCYVAGAEDTLSNRFFFCSGLYPLNCLGKSLILFSGLWIKWIPLFLNSLAMWYDVPRSKSAHHDGQYILIDTTVESRFTKVLNQHYVLASKPIQHSIRPYHTDRPLCQHHLLHVPGKILPTSKRCPTLYSHDQHIHVSS